MNPNKKRADPLDLGLSSALFGNTLLSFVEKNFGVSLWLH